MQAIARRAGVSRSTVSFVLNGRAQSLRISADTCGRVLQVAQEMNYQTVSPTIKPTRKQRRVLGLFVPTVSREPFGSAADAVIEAAQDRALLVEIVRLAPDLDAKSVYDVEKYLPDMQLAGAVVLGVSGEVSKVIRQQAGDKTPVECLAISDVNVQNAVALLHKICNSLVAYALFIAGDAPFIALA